MNNCKMTHLKLKNAFCYSLLFPTLTLLATACTNTDRTDDEIENPVDSTEVLTEHSSEVETQDTVIVDSIDLDGSKLDKIQLDSIKSEFQARLDTGIDMLGTAREEYLYLVDLKNNYKDWLAQNCAKGYNDYSISIDKWEASIQTAMDEEEKELRQEFDEENWGRDMDMMIYGAGTQQLYLYLEDLIASSEDWCK